MAKILLTHPYLLKRDPHQFSLKQPYPPLGTLQVASLLQAKGHKIEWIDPMFDPSLERLKTAIGNTSADVLCIIPDDHSVQIKQCTSQVRTVMFELLEAAKRRGLPAIVSGPDASDYPDLFIDKGASAVASGEVADSLVDWLDAKEGEAVNGIHGQFGGGGRRQPQSNLDEWPDALWEICNLAPYASMWRQHHGIWELNVWTTRGCPYRCHWCAKPIWGRSFAVRSPRRVFEEIQYLRRTHQPDRIWFTDDIFALQKSWLNTFSNLVQPLPLPFRCLSRADLLRDSEYASLLSRAGCDKIWMGAESGSDSVLEAMGKDATVEDVRLAMIQLKQHGIHAGLFLQLGYPGETLNDVLKTVDMIKELSPEEIGVSVSYPLPGTQFYEQVKDSLSGQQWGNSMENLTLHPAPYMPIFYRHAKGVLRSTHSSQQLSRRSKDLLKGPTPKRIRRWVGAMGHRIILPVAIHRMHRHAVENSAAINITVDTPIGE